MLSKPLAQPKPRPKLLDTRKAKAAIQAEDRRENATVKARSGGRCEMLERVRHERIRKDSYLDRPLRYSCPRRAVHVHHLISGIGRRNQGASIKASHKLHVCENCHREIHAHVLRPFGIGRESAATVVYERVK